VAAAGLGQLLVGMPLMVNVLMLVVVVGVLDCLALVAMVAQGLVGSRSAGL
jgi:hypothetical protein